MWRKVAIIQNDDGIHPLIIYLIITRESNRLEDFMRPRKKEKNELDYHTIPKSESLKRAINHILMSNKSPS